MAPDVQTINRDPDLEWLDLIRPTGLVLSPTVIKERGLIPERQTAADSAAFAACLSEEAPALPEPWRLFAEILGWDAGFVAGAPAAPALPDDLAFAVPEHDTTLFPDWAVQGFGEDAPWQVLVRLEPAGADPDGRGEADGWEATPHQRFERLLRETGVLVGILISDQELRLIYAPKGETSGWLAFPLRSLATVAGRPMLAGLKLVLGRFRLFNAPADQRLRALLKASRDAQAAVSTELSAQVLGALHELLRGLNAAEPSRIQDLAERRPDHLYEGLLTVLLRLVFILYAEDRDLLPSATDGSSRALYEQSYSVRGLYAKLAEDDALNPDTMDERLGGWGRLLVLFRLIHKGHRSGFIRARRGKLFDPDEFPFLEGRSGPDNPPRVVKLSDGCLLRILEGLMTLADPGTKVRQRLSYRTLDVEQIGSVYETIMGFTVQTAPGRVLAIKAGKHNRTPVFAELERLAALKPAERAKYLKDVCKREGTLPKAVATALGQAGDADAIAAALDPIADERGSPRRSALGAGTPILQPTEERRRTGSHYTPRDLTEPIVRHALRPILERLGADATPALILDLKVCDPAIGSGAFLVEACRQLAERLVESWARHPGTRPPIPADEDEGLLARRLIAQRCLYGVDRNPMAVDLARLSLWLVTLARNHEFTFLDHALKPGDSLVGLELDQIEALHWDARTSDAQLSLTRLLVRDRLGKVEAERQRIREAVEDASEDDLRPVLMRAQAQLADPKLMGDAVIAAFFRGASAKERETARAEVQAAVEMGGREWRERLAPHTAALTVTPFHWPLEFPEVFFGRANSGFDAIVGNPPFQGGTQSTEATGEQYTSWLTQSFDVPTRRINMVAYFFLRAFDNLRSGGVFALVATNKISQGETREHSLLRIIQSGGHIYRATRRMRWPGEADVVISIVHVIRGVDLISPYIDGRPVSRISAYLSDINLDESPFRLAENQGKAFMGTKITGIGFTFDDREAAKGNAASVRTMESILDSDSASAEVIFPFMGAEEINNTPDHAFRRYVIDLTDFSEEVARARWPRLVDIIERHVKPERDKLLTKGGWSAEIGRNWWRLAQRADKLNELKRGLSHVIVTASSAVMHHVFAYVDPGPVFSHKLIVIASDDIGVFGVLQSRVHEIWSRAFGTTFGAGDALTYSSGRVFATFPMPQLMELRSGLECRAYLDGRAELLIQANAGLTRMYGCFHDRMDRGADVEALRELHHSMDQAVLRAYGWDHLAASAAPVFLNEENEDEFAYRGRLFWPSDFRDEVLARLLALNAERHADEVRRGVALRQGARGRATESDAEDEEDAT